MSSRNVRKLYGTTTLPPPDVSSEEEYQPLYVKNSTESKFRGLVLSSESESEPIEPVASGVIKKQAPKPIPDVSKASKNKKKQRKGKHGRVKPNDLDEIDKYVKEVNDMLGEPPQPNLSKQKAIDPKIALMTISSKHLNYENELRRVFGPDEGEEGRRQRQNNRTRLHKATIVPTLANVMRFPCRGLSMSLERTQGDCNYFLFNHSLEYQKKFRVILRRLMGRTASVPPMNESEIELNNLTIEGMLENIDTYFQYEEYTAANKSLEQAILTMQALAHPSFNLTDPRTRLEYKYFENRIFHVTVLKYLHLLTNKACHRTALELAKVLLNLDPSDPLAILFIIDILALRAREHRWLIDVVDHWSTERDAGFLFNIQYSYAMAHFHVATKNREDLSTADELLQLAILAYPTVVVNILECANSPNVQIQTHELFTTFSEPTMVRDMKVLVTLYAKFTWSRWREGPVMTWLVKNALDVIHKFDTDPSVKERAQKLAAKRMGLFRFHPVEVIRHLCIIKPMADLIVDGAMPHFFRTVSANPASEVSTGIDRYHYYGIIEGPIVNSATTLLASFMASILPEHPQGLNDPALRERLSGFQFFLPEEEDIVIRSEDFRVARNIAGQPGATGWTEAAAESRGDADGDAGGGADGGASGGADGGASGGADGGASGGADEGASGGADGGASGGADEGDSDVAAGTGIGNRTAGRPSRQIRVSELVNSLLSDFVNAGPNADTEYDN